MSNEHGEEHGEYPGPIHQAPWVTFVTIGTCLGFLGLVLFAKYMAGAL